MRAVNLIPEELRPRVPGDGDPRIAYGVLGGLALLLVFVLISISYSNKLKTIQDQTAAVQAEAQAHKAKAASFTVSPDELAADVKNRTLLVGGLAKTRFPWDDALGDLSKSMPSDTTLDSITGTSGTGGNSGNTATPASMALTGCTSSWVPYARFMTWLKQLPGVDSVESTSSSIETADTSSDDPNSVRKRNCGPYPLNFALTVTYRPRTVDLTGLPKPDGGATGATGAAPAGVPASAPAPVAAPAGGE